MCQLVITGASESRLPGVPASHSGSTDNSMSAAVLTTGTASTTTTTTTATTVTTAVCNVASWSCVDVQTWLLDNDLDSLTDRFLSLLVVVVLSSFVC